MRRFITYILLLLAALTMTGCATLPVSDEKLDEMGAEVHDKIIEEYGVYSDQKLQSYVENIGYSVGEASGYSRTRLKFVILDTPDINAFSVPGGYIFVTRGLLARANSEAELAMVLGHEIGHLTARHSAKRISQIMSAGLFTNFLSMFIGVYTKDADLANLVGSIVNFGSIIVILDYGREAEFEADKLGVEYAFGAEYDPHASMKFLHVLEELEKASNRERYPLFDTHPPSKDRIEKASGVANQLVEQGSSGKNFIIAADSYKKMLDGLVLGESFESGIIKNDMYMTRNYDFTLKKLDGWKIVKARSYRTALISGQNNVFLVYADIPRGATTLKDHAVSFLREKLEKESLTPELDASSFEGLNAYEYFARPGKSVRFLFFQKQGIYYSLVFSYAPGAFSDDKAAWRTLLNAFSFMNKETRDSINEDKMSIYSAKPEDNSINLGKKFYNDVSLGEKLLEYNGLKDLALGDTLKVPPVKHLLGREDSL